MTPQELEALLAEVKRHELDNDYDAAHCVRANIAYTLAPALLDLWRAAEEWHGGGSEEATKLVEALARLREVRL